MGVENSVFQKYRKLLWLTGAVVFLGALFPVSAQESTKSLARQISERSYTDDLPDLRRRKRIRALVTYSLTDFFFDETGAAKGLQVDLLKEYEKALNKGVKREAQRVRIEYVPTTFDRLIPDLLEGRGDIAAALLTVTPERESRVEFISGKRQKVRELVVTHRSVEGIESIDDLGGNEVYVLKGSSYAEHLRDLNRERKKGNLKLVEVREADPHLLSEDILELVNAGAVKITVVDDYKAKLWANVLPDIRVLDSVAIRVDTHIGWAIRKNNPELRKSLESFLQKVKKGTFLGNMLFKRYLQSTKWIDNPNTEENKARLLQLIELFDRYGERYGFDGLAIAAQGYQESQLDHSKKSPRGAVGIMQMLPSTAADKSVAIPDIGDEEDNIHAGVKYLAFLRDRYFSDPGISEEDRMAFAWAAYNAGPAKVRAMRNQAKKMGLNPDVWHSNVELAAGKLVGRETVRYVRNIFKYYVAYKLVREQLRAADRPRR